MQANSPFYRTAKRVNGHAVWTGRVNVNERAMDQPLRWKRPRKIFVNSLSDLFHESVSDATIDRIFAVMAQCPQHTFQILTKRAERMRDYCEMVAVRNGIGGADFPEDTPIPKFVDYPLRNVWLGVSVENQAAADERIPLLLPTPAAVRFLSCEPLLGPINFALVPGFNLAGQRGVDLLRNMWVIAGGESGRDARPMHPDWARSLRDQCARAGVPFFFKQWGEYLPGDMDFDGKHHTWAADAEHFEKQLTHERYHVVEAHGVSFGRVGKGVAGAMLDGVEHKAFPVGA